MNRRRETAKRILILAVTVAVFAVFNAGVYLFATNRLGSSFGDAGGVKMIDVGKYLPHEEGSDLARIDASLALEGDLPVLDGAAALVPVYAAFVDNVYPEGSVVYEGGSFSDDNYYGENFAPDSAMQFHNTVRGFTALIDGETDLFFSAAPSAEQRKYAEEKGVAFACVPIGLEAFVFFVNAKNPVDGLTVGQVREIYEGKITNWAELGGPDRLISPVTRPEGSGSQSAMEAFMGGRTIAPKPFLAIAGGSIGYSFRYYFEQIVGDEAVKMLSLDGVYPGPERIRSREYPVVTEFYAMYREDNENPNVPRLVDWILSDEGQTVIEGSGYVGIR